MITGICRRSGSALIRSKTSNPSRSGIRMSRSKTSHESVARVARPSLSVHCHEDLVALLDQPLLEQPAVQRVVVDDQDASGARQISSILRVAS